MPRASLLLLLALAACSPTSGPPAVAPQRAAPVPSSPPTPPPPASSPRAPASAAADEPVAIPAGALYGCVVGSGGQRRVAAIELAPRLAELCSKNPEMGPCQYEREACRRSGGRVFAADGTEITAATEAEYDRKVARIRLRAD
jgi:hypothetical protein